MDKNDAVKGSVSKVIRNSDYQGREDEKERGNGSEIVAADFSTYQRKKNENPNIFINLTEGEKILIEGWSYLEHKLN